MRLIQKSGFLLVFVALSSVGQISFPTNDDHFIAVTAVAIGRMCAEQKPEMNYSLQNLLSMPDRGVTSELKKEIAKVDADPSLQDEIMAIQIHAAGDSSAMKYLCPSYAPKDTK
ncbi:hypothetical protein [Pseudomonas brassicacearum]|jgi:hypothetical protein|uniref:hypothetical protein n=1 Tax=Pseudomonas brassicacearum TaxID=930166 RepID=UPI0005B9A4CE|nr:hypothetical protein [Pseudomonas brassicacearum]AOS42112.1 hypothetical protein A0U95_26140 [Pseudomonas brassicacearum]KIR14892.1 hypothetical protein PFLU4_40820 [Pseudomonas fluorescens]